MSENIFEYIVMPVLLLGLISYFLRDSIKGYFQPLSMVVSPHAFSRKVKHGYLNLLDLLYHNSNKNDLEKEIRYIATQRSDGRYVGGYTKDTDEFDSLSFSLDYFYDLINYTEKNREDFIFSLAKNTKIEDLNSLISTALGELIGSVTLPNPLKYSDNTTLSFENVFSDYQKALNQSNIQMALLDDGSDTYYALLHDLDKTYAVEKAVSDIGFKYTIKLN